MVKSDPSSLGCFNSRVGGGDRGRCGIGEGRIIQHRISYSWIFDKILPLLGQALHRRSSLTHYVCGD